MIFTEGDGSMHPEVREGDGKNRLVGGAPDEGGLGSQFSPWLVPHGELVEPAPLTQFRRRNCVGCLPKGIMKKK